MGKRQLVLVSGLSGAGKSITMDYFEALGYYCVDNLPIDSLYSVVTSLKKNINFYNYAIAISSNCEISSINQQLTKLNLLDWLNIKILYLDASDQVLLNRYQLTRKHHPLTHHNETLINAINQERQLLKPFNQVSQIKIDTSDLTSQQLLDKLSKLFNKEITDAFKLVLVSFGYKNGLPNDLDYAFDVRFLDNPYYIEELKHQTGNESSVYNYVMEQEKTKEFLEKLIPFLDYCIDNQVKINRSFLVVGIGCTGGQHRSVSIVNYLYQYYCDKYQVIKDHKDVK